jgi:hypothetical protein
MFVGAVEQALGLLQLGEFLPAWRSAARRHALAAAMAFGHRARGPQLERGPSEMRGSNFARLTLK